MTDKTSSGPAPMDVRPVKPKLWQRLSLVWFVPLIALGISLWAAWQNYSDRGTLIEISFEDASGITAGETMIKFRDVDIGQVESVKFADGLGDVLVYARVDNNVAPYLDDDAQFWVVEPDVSVRGISGLQTVLSGVYIGGSWDTDADVQQYKFIGSEEPILTTANQRGTRIVLRASSGSALLAGAPVLHKGIQVGYLEEPQLSLDATEVVVNAFIEAPYDRRLTTNTRFWDTSGFSVSFGANGFLLDFNSIASLIEGGIAFDSLVSGGDPVEDGAVYDVFYDEDTARSSVFEDPVGAVVEVAVLFDQAVTGLTVGSAVRFQGIRIGQVSALNAVVVGEGADAQVVLQTVLALEPTRFGMDEDATPDEVLTLLSDFVSRGLRARLVTGNILAGTLVVELVELEDALPAILNRTSGPYPVIPTTESVISDVAATAEGVLARINALPIEELMDSTIDLMTSLESLASDQATRNIPTSVMTLVDEARNLVASEDLQAIPGDLRTAINDLNSILAEASEAELVTKLTDIIDKADAATENISLATENLPAITTEIEALAAKANGLAVESLVEEATETLATIDTLLGSDETADLPRALTGSLDELRAFLAEVREGGAIENVNAALESANEAAAAIEEAVAGLPELSNRASSLVAQTEAVLESYGDRSRFSAETISTLRDIQAAADAIANLARTIQRNPNSLLTGR